MLSVSFAISIIIVTGTASLLSFLVSKEKIKAANNPYGRLQDVIRGAVLTLKKMGIGILFGGMSGSLFSNEILKGKYVLALMFLFVFAGIGAVLYIEKRNIEKIRSDTKAFQKDLENSWRNLNASYTEASDPQYGDFSQVEMQQLTELIHGYEECRNQIESGVVQTDILPRLRELDKSFSYLNGRRMMRYSAVEFENKRKAFAHGSGHKSNGQQQTEKRGENAKSENFSFFTGCNTTDEIKSRYRNLCRTYHPDTGSGDKEVFERITEEYEKLLKKA